MPRKVAVPAGTKFGYWTVLEEAEPKVYPSGCVQRMMRCQCKCGRIKDVQLGSLRNNNSKGCSSCGNTKYGQRESPEWRCWSGMHQRCYNKNDKNFAGYGGRGVHVCERWHRDNPDGFINFLEDMGKRPSAKHSLDKDSIKPGNLCYCPEFCCWATRKEQQRARRSNRMLEFQGRTQCLAAWAEELGLTRPLIWARLRSGWSVEDALTRPVQKHNRKAA